jgi:ribosomal-protein-alanine N-acetyltransferase
MRTEVIGTSRLSLCGAHPSDFEALYHCVFADATVMRHVMAGRPLSFPEAHKLYVEKFDAECLGQKPGVLVERASDEAIGFSGLMPCAVLGAAEFELGFVLARKAWGKGYAQEIGRAQLSFGFSKLGCSRLLAQVAPENIASIRALSGIGMQLHSTIESPGRGMRHVYVASAA